MEQVVSNCCGAPLVPIETEICSECYEHCEAVERDFQVCVEAMHKFINDNPNTEVKFLNVPIITGELFTGDSLIIWHKVNLETGEITKENGYLRF